MFDICLFYSRIFLISFSLFSLVIAPHVQARTLLFEDDFERDILGDNYTYYLNEGSISLSEGKLIMEAPFGRTYPNIHYDHPLPLDSYQVEIKFRFEKLARYGIGALLGDRKLNNGIAPTLNDIIYNNWGDSHAGHEYRYLMSSGDLFQHITKEGLDDWHVKLYERDGNINKYYLDDALLGLSLSDRRVTHITFGNTDHRTNPDNWTSLVIDYFRIWDTGEYIPEFASYYSQLDEEWTGIEYDSSSEWAAEGKRGIGEWGCALSSAAMILKNYDTLSPSGLTTTPPVLNAWLKSQPDGYIGGGLLNWLAVSRYARESHLHEPPYAPHALEYERLGYTESFVSEKIEADKPVILSNSGHSVVAFEEGEEKWWVADPVASASSELAKDAAISRVHSYTPSSTDLSYMMFVSESETSFELLNGGGESVALDTWIEELKSSSGEAKSQKIVLLAKPASGEYKLTVTGGGFQSYLYDKEGRVTVDSFTESGEYEISFDGLDTSKSDVKEASLPIPVAPDLVAPADNSFSNKKQVTLAWASTLDSLRYEYEVRNSLVEVVLSGSSDVLQTIWKPTIEDLYTWRVRACNLEDVCGEWSEARAITIDRTAPKLVGQTEFSGWYHEAQTSYFQLTDEHMLADFSDPSCEIKKQGKNIKCSLKAKICDLAGNCYSKKLVSNPANIDWTAPATKAKLLSLPSWWYRLTKGWRVGGVIIETSDKHSGVSETLYRVNSGEWKVYKHPFVVADRSPIVVEYKAIDVAGNESQVKSVRMK